MAPYRRGHFSDSDLSAMTPGRVPAEEQDRMALTGRPGRPPDFSPPHEYPVDS
jgi:hypothetical protein